jgi:hypothetical protein
VTVQPTESIFLFSAGLVVGLTGFCYWQRRRYPLLLAVWSCYLVLLVPMLGWTEHPHFASDRYSTIAAMGWSMLAVAGLLRIERHGLRRFVGGVAALSITVCAAASVNQTGIWRDTETLLAHGYATRRFASGSETPHSPRQILYAEAGLCAGS